jgi:hypothetical protein
MESTAGDGLWPQFSRDFDATAGEANGKLGLLKDDGEQVTESTQYEGEGGL